MAKSSTITSEQLDFERVWLITSLLVTWFLTADGQNKTKKYFIVLLANLFITEHLWTCPYNVLLLLYVTSFQADGIKITIFLLLFRLYVIHGPKRLNFFFKQCTMQALTYVILSSPQAGQYTRGHSQLWICSKSLTLVLFGSW